MANPKKKILTPVPPMVAGFALAKKKITAAILQVPSGQVASYSQIGEAAGFVRAARLVARVLREAGNDRPPSTKMMPNKPSHSLAKGATEQKCLPWWRIVRSDGSCAIEGQLDRLKLEGITLKQSRIDMARHRWEHMDYLLFGIADDTL
jgi:alkylated DNA nucleotide flippase Atl1